MERRPTLPVTEILAAERQERSWESALVPGRWGHPSVADRGRGIGDLGMAGLNIGAPAHCLGEEDLERSAGQTACRGQVLVHGRVCQQEAAVCHQHGSHE